MELILKDKEIEFAYFILCVMLVLFLGLGFFLGENQTNDKWKDYHNEYKEKVMEKCGYDPELLNNSLGVNFAWQITHS